MSVKLYRPCVRVIPIKGKKVYIGKKLFEGKLIFEFPGGGIDKGMTAEQAVVEEAREEAGLLLRDPVRLGIVFKYERDKPFDRDGVTYVGGEDTWFMATFDKTDKRVYDSQGDGMQMMLVSIDEARRLLVSVGYNEYTRVKLEALEKVRSLIDNRHANALENW